MQQAEIAGIKEERASRRQAPSASVLSTGTLLYVAIGGLFLLSLGENPLLVLLGFSGAFELFAQLVSSLVPLWLLLPGVALLVLNGPLRRHIWAQKVPSLAALVYCSIFVLMFGLVKNNLPSVIPFWADDVLTSADLALHFGHTPHAMVSWLSGMDVSTLLRFYLNSWVVPATYLPFILTALDPNPERRRTFILLWMGCWIVLGNLIAVCFMSYGPIFSDLFADGNAQMHEGVLTMLQRDDAWALEEVKMKLWTAYTGELPMAGSGISAFPSVHVGMATVIALYLIRLVSDWTRTLRLPQVFGRGARIASWFIAAGYVAVYLVLSVYLGWHYALDGYVSILVIGGLYALLRRRETLWKPALQAQS